MTRLPRGLALALVLTAGCAPASLVDVQPPSGVVDPNVAASAGGAAQLYAYAISSLSGAYGGGSQVACGAGNFITTSGALTDELQLRGNALVDFDIRNPNAGFCPANLYSIVNQPRIEAGQAREAMRLYAPTPVALQGRLAGTEGFGILMLAELFCSGIPLSTVSFAGVTTPTAGFATDELFARAAALFDTAIALGTDSISYVYMAKVGKGRALLGQGKIAEAAQAVQAVPTTFSYLLTYTTVTVYTNAIGSNPRTAFTSDREGANGLVWSADPRTAIVTTPALSSAMPYSAKYSKTAAGVLDPTQTITSNPVVLASGLEARLIEAEADLAAGGTNWLTILNLLRTTCIGISSCAPVPGLTAASLPPLTDPGSPTSRLDLLMKERAMWLFLTGHRQGDARRLTRVYHRDPETVWPTGVYVNPGFPPLITGASQNGSSYGATTVLTTGGTNVNEVGINPLYQGCFNLDP